MNKRDKELEYLISACIQNDRRAQKKFFDIYSPILYPICIRYVKDINDANDVLQLGFMKIFKNLPSYQPSGSFEGWIKRIIINTAIEQLRKKKNHLDIDEMTGIETPSIQNTAIQDMNAAEIIKLIAFLPEGYRTVFNLFCIDGFSHKEIAEQMGTTESTSKSQLFKARKLLQKWLEELF